MDMGGYYDINIESNEDNLSVLSVYIHYGIVLWFEMFDFIIVAGFLH